MVDSVDFAKYLLIRVSKLNENREKPIQMNETKLHKLVYICDGYLLAANINLISEHARAWNYGPVYPRVRLWLAKNPSALSGAPGIDPGSAGEIGRVDGIDRFIDSVLRHYGAWSAEQLSLWSHGPGSPWELALERGRGRMNSVIKKNDMARYFEEMFNGSAA